MRTEPPTVRVVAGLAEVSAEAWDALVHPSDPFLEHGFLRALETSGAVGPGTGWRPAHVLVEAGGHLRAAAPCYVKTDSYGEYIFDWGWADACRRAGIPYYPKLVVAVPFTPASGQRVLVEHEAWRPALLSGVRALADRVGASSVHWLFARASEVRELAAEGHVHRVTHQYHWTNEGYGTYDDFLASLKSKRRKETRRERRQAEAHGLQLAVEPAHTLSREDLQAVHACYLSTISDRWSRAYLPEAWFLGLSGVAGRRAVVATARRDGKVVAMSLAFHRGDALFGRYWGALEALPAMHFELCYHRLIAWSIDHGVRRFEAGAQGEHKIPRGFLPAPIHSAHWLRHPGLAEAVASHVAEERDATQAWLTELTARGPYTSDRLATACAAIADAVRQSVAPGGDDALV